MRVQLEEYDMRIQFEFDCTESTRLMAVGLVFRMSSKRSTLQRLANSGAPSLARGHGSLSAVNLKAFYVVESTIFTIATRKSKRVRVRFPFHKDQHHTATIVHLFHVFFYKLI